METYRYSFENEDNDKNFLIVEDGKQNCSKGRSSNSYDYGSNRTSGKSTVRDHVVLRWKNISVFTKTSNRIWLPTKQSKLPKKQIISDVSGVALPGQLLAIMGSSGSGKTTLLNVLTLRSPRNQDVTGSVLINGQHATPSAMSETAGYVQQEDLFFGTLTVKEQLTFQALLRMDDNMSNPQRMKRVEEVIIELGLTDCQNTLIGVPGRVKGISGGEKRRLSLAAEVLTDPQLLFCDEPTSGLDIFMAQNVVALLRSMARKGKTVLCTIHQPSSDQFTLFDRIMLVAEGKVAFLGPPEEALNFFSRIQHPSPPNYNPADHFINVLSAVNNKGNEEQKKRDIEKICQTFASSEAAIFPLQELEKLSTLKNVNGELNGKWLNNSGTTPSGYKVSLCHQFRVLMWRSCLCVIREPLLCKMRLYQTLVLSLILGAIFWGQQLNQRGVHNINGAMFLILANFTYQYVAAVINVICGELPIFLRERRNDMYRTEVYFICKNIAELPNFIVMPVLMTTILYWMIGLNPQVNNFLFACLIIVLVANVCVSVGYVISTVSSSVNVAITMMSPVVLPMIICGGYFLNIRSIPWFFAWIQYISWIKYAYEALIINQWSDIINIDCSDSNTTCSSNGLAVLQTFNFPKGNFELDIFMLVVLIIGYKLLALLALCVRVKITQ